MKEEKQKRKEQQNVWGKKQDNIYEYPELIWSRTNRTKFIHHMFKRAKHVHFQKYYLLKVISSDMVSVWLVEEKMQDLWLLHNTVCICQYAIEN